MGTLRTLTVTVLFVFLFTLEWASRGVQGGTISKVEGHPASGNRYDKKRILKELQQYKEPPDDIVRSMAFKVKPPLNLDHEWRNFCWNQSIHGSNKFLCLPYFYIVGFRKCATSDIFERINVHPELNLPFRKETLWWSFRPFWSFTEYADIFGGVTYPRGKKVIMGDADPNIAFMHRRTRDHIITKAHIMKMYTPDVRVIFMLRNPTDRMYSDYLYIRGLGTRTAGDFNRRVLRGWFQYKRCFAAKSVRDCIYNQRNMFSSDRNQIRLYQGMYIQYIYDWMQVFPRNQILVLRSEDLFSDGKKTLSKVFDFLGVDKLNDEELGAILEFPLVNRNDVVKKSAGPMWKQTRDLLNKMYRPFNEALAEYMHDKRFLWEA
ncbi:carbohydrate sulfotransferase 15-like [Lineus longissimus]|uniref:carbohydrate sulfotransferase 15-like n=1 Tax=Lineus longissimus TaxID=88925 RepID=UPI00315D6228